jgi:hypothetical protein
MDRDELLRSIDLVALLDELATLPATRLGNNARWHCIDPGHDDQRPSVTMFTDQRGVQRWRCWSGGHGGTAIDAVVTATGCSVGDAIHRLEVRAGRPGAEPSTAAPIPRRVAPDGPVDPALLEWVAACERILWTAAGRVVRDYLTNERGVPSDVLAVNHVGADPGPIVLRRAGGLPRGGPAAVLPALDGHGHVIYAQARYLEPRDKPKYDNPAARIAPNPRLNWTRTPQARRSDRLIVCEGTPDALTANAAGYPAVAVLGATYADHRTAGRISDHAAGRRLVIAFDGDHAGQTAAHRLADAFHAGGAPADILAVAASTDLNMLHRRDRHWLARQLAPLPRPDGLGRGLARSIT